ncbi:GspH/FimT family pseudopilin [Methylomonas methanica]|uniref:Type II secretion system protein H n=1 Tax=Methylomonas methanica (strain DSM 25384 / MC09) TaxID=857087 RepID=G0A6T4_METMM|nr:GspH/FimT family pseudopilin [Methylomonas methanica]AEG00555.1 Tfp pilus assembly protein FimT [Methylomonas methanica MC09]
MCTKHIKSLGFTLIELMVTIAIAAILLGVAIPGFNSIIASNKLTTYANDLITTFNVARSEAIKRGQQVTITRISSTAGVWEGGWNIFVDVDGNNAFNDDGNTTLCQMNSDGSPSEDCLIKTFPALSNGYTIRTGSSAYQNYVAYLPSGLAKNAVGDTFRICDSSANNSKSKAIIISAAGRARAQSGTVSCP